MSNRFIKMATITLLFFSLFVSGCASSIRKEIRSYEYQIDQQNELIQNSEKSLSNNPNVYIKGECRLPQRRSKPEPFCDTKEYARNHAVARCAIAYKGCDLALKSLKDNLDTVTKQFLASEACSRLVAKLQKEKYTPSDAFENLVGTISSDRCEKGGFFGKLFGCTTKVAVELAKFDKFQKCYTSEANGCYAKYVNWYNEPFDRQEKCQKNIKQIADSKNSISDLEYEIYKRKRTLTWRLFGDD